LDRFDVLMSKMIFKKWKNIINMHFNTKSYLKSTRNHTVKHTLNLIQLYYIHSYMFFRAYSGTWSVYVLFPMLYYNVVATVHRVDNFIIWCKPIARIRLPMALMWPPFCGCQYMSCHARPSNPIIGPLVHPFLWSNFFFFFFFIFSFFLLYHGV